MKAIGRLFASLLLSLPLVSTATAAAVDREFQFQLSGESRHWAVVLNGFGPTKDGSITFAEVRPLLIWTGGGLTPEQFDVKFRVAGTICGDVKVTATDRTRKLLVLGVCKLPSSGAQGSPASLLKSLMDKGEFKVQWDRRRETVTWLFGYPLSP